MASVNDFIVNNPSVNASINLIQNMQVPNQFILHEHGLKTKRCSIETGGVFVCKLRCSTSKSPRGWSVIVDIYKAAKATVYFILLMQDDLLL